MKEKLHDNSGAYRVMAQFYDKLMGGNKYPGWKSLIAEVIETYRVPKGTCLDVACGTGNISHLLFGLGFKVVGIDISHEMISLAKQKLPTEKFICADARNFDLGLDRDSINFAVSFYDSLNYLLSDEDMLQTFKSVNRNIKSGSIFLFDMNPQEHISVAQKFKPRVFEDKDIYSVFRFGGEKRFWILDIDFFIKGAKDCYRLVKERHIERGYDQEDIAPLLEQAGFKLLKVKKEFKIYEDNKRHLSRLYFIAQKI
ncbi:MAG: class I SAM-dependent methyltransferase [Candidatus Moranbacteria bacterium]|nr:class I SAM-dependent methyltransferase [Candidatus Moranbacteria bacterium]